MLTTTWCDMAALQLNRRVFGTRVRLIQSCETGVVEGFLLRRRDRVPQFLVEYVTSDGRATVDWFYQDQIETLSTEEGQTS